MTKNPRRIGDHVFSGATVALVLAASSLAAGASVAPAQAAAQAQHGAGTVAQQQAGSLLVLPASELIGRPLKDSQGHDAGQVQAVVLDTQNGAIDFVVIGGDANFDLNGGVIAVPWSMLEPPTSAQGALTVKASADKLRQAPRLNQNAFADLSESRSRANIYSYYGHPNRGPRSGYAARGTSYGAAPVGGNGGAAGPSGAPGGYSGGRPYYGPGNGYGSGNGAPAAGNAGVAAARAANAHDFIMALPEGYRTAIGDRGARLSGGERQRLALARAFLADAPIIVLDEPTSAIDPQTEAAIVESLERLRRGRTVFMIAHRLGTLRHVDIRLRVEDGRVSVEQDLLADALAQAS